MKARPADGRTPAVSPLRILLIGALPPPIGGVSVSFQILVGLLASRGDIQIEVLDLAAIRRGRGRFVGRLLRLLQSLWVQSRNVEVITLYTASTALPTLGLLVLLLARLWGKPFVMRKAAGTDYLDLGLLKGRMAHFVVRHADLYLAQTKNLVRLALERGVSRVKWYPTSRPMGQAPEAAVEDRPCRRFVFVGHVRECKGIREIVQAAERFPEGIGVDLYGPLFDDVGSEVFVGCRRVKYCGSLSPEAVIPTLQRYDLALLPTKAATEGYPGAVFEAYAAGLPLITTRCGGIPEIVDETSGLWVEPGNPDSLFEAMKAIVENEELYRTLRQGVSRKREEFDASVWADRFVEYCREVVHART